MRAVIRRLRALRARHARRARCAIAAAILCAASGAVPVRASAPDVELDRDVMVTMRDGTKLAADIYRPARERRALEGRFPALLMRTPYNKEVRGAAFADYFAARGYVVVVQDVRGRYRSEGRWRPLVDDGNDGYDTGSGSGNRAGRMAGSARSGPHTRGARSTRLRSAERLSSRP